MSDNEIDLDAVMLIDWEWDLVWVLLAEVESLSENVEDCELENVFELEAEPVAVGGKEAVVEYESVEDVEIEKELVKEKVGEIELDWEKVSDNAIELVADKVKDCDGLKVKYESETEFEYVSEVEIDFEFV